MPSERLLCLETAKTVARQGHTAEAIKLYERAEQLDPTAAPVDAKLAPLYADVGNSDAAIERYKRCLLRSPNDIELANNFAWTLMEAGRFDQAISEIDQALQAEPDNVRLRSTLAVIHYRQGDHPGALRHFEKAYGSDAAHHNLAILDIDNGNFESAKTHLQIAKQSNKLDTKTQSLASVFESKGSIR
ncbi:tetratricopeptide repeat protein [Rhodopirellula europaea]|nr:tetratricopeptide repeat protein [Rhodopirellula europaea]